MYRRAMSIKDIVHCYVKSVVPAPQDMAALRDSFIENGFCEKYVTANKWLYKRGAPVALEFDYGSEAIQIQVILEHIGKDLSISVGNWGFPFEPLLMKPRFKRQLASIVEQVNLNGVLTCDPKRVEEISQLSKQKSSAAKLALLAAAAGAALITIIKNT